MRALEEMLLTRQSFVSTTISVHSGPSDTKAIVTPRVTGFLIIFIRLLIKHETL
jgi:hypothetical protein